MKAILIMNAHSEEFTSETDAGLTGVVRDRIDSLRKRLLDSSRRNPLIQIPFRANSTGIIRFIDEMPDDLAERLADRQMMRLKPLPAAR